MFKTPPVTSNTKTHVVLAQVAPMLSESADRQEAGHYVPMQH